MSRVTFPTRENIPERYKAAYDRLLRERGDPIPDVFLALANLPHCLDSLLSFTRDMRHGSVLDPRIRELVILMVGLRTQTQYEFDHHWNSALRAGVSREQLERLSEFETAEIFGPIERAALAYAVEVTDGVSASDECWGSLKELLSQAELMDLVMTVAWYNAVVRILKPLRIETEHWFQRN